MELGAIFDNVTELLAILPLVTALAANFDVVTAPEPISPFVTAPGPIFDVDIASGAIFGFVTDASLISLVPSPLIHTHPLHTTSPAMVTANALIWPLSGVTARNEAPTIVPATMTRTHVKETLYSLMIVNSRIFYKTSYG